MLSGISADVDAGRLAHDDRLVAAMCHTHGGEPRSGAWKTLGEKSPGIANTRRGPCATRLRLDVPRVCVCVCNAHTIFTVAGEHTFTRCFVAHTNSACSHALQTHSTVLWNGFEGFAIGTRVLCRKLTFCIPANIDEFYRRRGASLYTIPCCTHVLSVPV